MDDVLYWVWLSAKQKLPVREQIALIKHFGDAESVYRAQDYRETGVSKASAGMLEDKDLSDAEKIIERICEIDGYILTLNSQEYPNYLRDIAVPPPVLYCKGQHIQWGSISRLTVVGTRRNSPYGRRATEDIVKELVRYGIVIVSGMARGIDSIAAKSAIRAGGTTIAVLGSGLDVIYPSENRELYNEICKKGVVITEFPPGTPPLKENFPRRNRIMAGLSIGLLVGQAPERGGSLITATYALAEGRNVYVIPSDIYDRGFAGSNNLIKQGAKLVSSAEDITEDYPYNELEKCEKDEISISLEGLAPNEAVIIKLLMGKEYHIDEITRRTALSSGEVNVALMMLEINGIVNKSENNVYSIT